MFKSFCVCLVGLCMATAAATAGDMWMGVYVGPRFNTAAGDAVKDFKNSGGTVSTVTQFAGGAFVILPLSPEIKLDLGLGYTQRGVKMEMDYEDGGLQATSSSSTATYNYLDLNLGLAWFMSGSNPDASFQPFLGVDLIPGFFLSGTTKSEMAGMESTEDVNKDNVESFNFALRPKLGADYMISSGILLGVNVGYELGLTNTNKTPANVTYTVPKSMWNGITTAVRLAFSL